MYKLSDRCARLNGKSNSVNQREDIIEALRKHPEGLTLRDIAEIVGHHRHTITKYVYELIGARVIYQREVGAAKLCYLRESYNGELKKADDEVPRKTGKGQAQLIALFMLLLLVPATVIVAQNVNNMTNSSSGLAGMLTGLNLSLNESADDVLSGVVENGSQEMAVNGTGADEPVISPSPNPEAEDSNLTGSNISLPDSGEDDKPIINETGNETNATLPDGLPISNETNLTVPNATFIDTNVTNVTAPNATAQEANETNMTITNETMQIEPIENVTGDNETLNLTENVTTTDENITEEPEIAVDIITPDKVTRGGEFELFAVVDNTGGSVAGEVKMEWMLPGFLTVTSGDVVHDCGDIAPLYTCTSAITVFADEDASLGLSEVKVRVDYVR